MKSTIVLKNQVVVGNFKPFQEDLEGTLNLSSLKIKPPAKVSSVIEVYGETKLTAISFHCNYVAILDGFSNQKEILYVIYLKQSRFQAIRLFDNPCSLLQFLPTSENLLFVGSDNGHIQHLDIESEQWTDVGDHESRPNGISNHTRSDLMLSWSKSEILVWLWPSCTLVRKLRVHSSSAVILAGHLWEHDELFAAFDSGTVMLWDRKQLSHKETVIETPDGIDMKFQAFSLSQDLEWLVGGGSEPMYVIYSLTSQRVSQVVHLPTSQSFFTLNDIIFLSNIHPQFSRNLLLASSCSIMITDLASAKIIKTLKSQQYPICHVCSSGDGFLLGVTYKNGTTKVYTLPSFYPSQPKEVGNASEVTSEIDFKILQQDEQQPKVKKKSQEEKVQSLLDSTKWLQILDEFGAYPDKYRKYIWSSVLRLPRNFSIFSNLLKREKKDSFSSLEAVFPEASKSLMNTLNNTLNCLCMWCPHLASVNVLPHLIFPFVEHFEDNSLLCFEVSVMLISNWFRPWIDEWPGLAAHLLSLSDQLICDDDPELWVHFKNTHVSPELYVSALLFTSLTKVFARKDWCIVWDHILSKPPSFLLCLITAFVLLKRESLLHCKQLRQTKSIFSQESCIPVKDILKKARKIFESIEETDPQLREAMDSVTYIPKKDLIPLSISVNERPKIEGATISQESRRWEILSHITANGDQTKYSRPVFDTLTSSSGARDRQTTVKSDSGLSFASHEEILKKGNDCLKKINNIRKKQVIRFT